jgi:hypothetical protein
MLDDGRKSIGWLVDVSGHVECSLLACDGTLQRTEMTGSASVSVMNREERA